MPFKSHIFHVVGSEVLEEEFVEVLVQLGARESGSDETSGELSEPRLFASYEGSLRTSFVCKFKLSSTSTFFTSSSPIDTATYNIIHLHFNKDAKPSSWKALMIRIG